MAATLLGRLSYGGNSSWHTWCTRTLTRTLTRTPTPPQHPRYRRDAAVNENDRKVIVAQGDDGRWRAATGILTGNSPRRKFGLGLELEHLELELHV